jgi:N-acetylglutamate synthase-like GNAT family acetyltransferase
MPASAPHKGQGTDEPMNSASPNASLIPKTAMGYRIRTAKRRDLGRIIAMDERVTGLRKPQYWEAFFERCTRKEATRFFLVAEDDGNIVGFISGEVRAWEFGSPPCGWVFAINIDPEMRESGVGSALFEALSKRFLRAGVHKIRTMLACDDHLLMSFFRSQGMMAGPYIELEKDLESEA